MRRWGLNYLILLGVAAVLGLFLAIDELLGGPSYVGNSAVEPANGWTLVLYPLGAVFMTALYIGWFFLAALGLIELVAKVLRSEVWVRGLAVAAGLGLGATLAFPNSETV